MSAEIIQEFFDFVQAIEPLIPAESVRVALDVGSRDALVALLLKTRFARANVFAFECNPEAIQLCRKNIGKRPITLVEKAATDMTGELDFFSIDPRKTRTPHADGNIGASSLFVANPEYPHETYVQNKIKVQATRLDDWARTAGISAIDILWMDVQGAALSVLKGLNGPVDLLSTVRAIFVELEYKPMYLGQPLADEVRAYLEKAGFSLYRRFYADDWFGNELFVRTELMTKF